MSRCGAPDSSSLPVTQRELRLLVLIWVLLFVWMILAPISVTNTGVAKRSDDGGATEYVVTDDNATYFLPPRFNGVPTGVRIGAQWVNIANGCGYLMKTDSGGTSCADSVLCPQECF